MKGLPEAPLYRLDDQLFLYFKNPILFENPALPRVLMITTAVYLCLVISCHFPLKKWALSTSNLNTKLITFMWFSWVPKSKFKANRSRGSWVMIGPTNRDYNFTYIHSINSWEPTQLRISKSSWEHSRGSPEFPHKYLRQIGPGVPELWSNKQTDRRTEITTLYI